MASGSLKGSIHDQEGGNKAIIENQNNLLKKQMALQDSVKDSQILESSIEESNSNASNQDKEA